MSSDLNVNRAYTNAWLVYINGLEVPVSSVGVSYGVGTVPEAEIVLVPDAVMQRFGAEDRVSVQVFYLDHWYGEESEFRLLFDGEIASWGYVNTQRGRSISIVAIDYIQIFTQIFFTFMSNIDDLAAGASAEATGLSIAGVQTAGLAALFPYSLFAQGLISAGDAPTPLIKRPIDYVYNLVRGLIHAQIPNRSLPAAVFFAPWVRRTKFHNRFIALPYLEDSDNPGVFPVLRAVQAQYGLQAVSALTSHIGSSGSLWDVFSQVLQTLFMELVMLPTAAAVQSDYTTLQVRGPAVVSKPTSPIFLTQYFVKPQMLFSLPPSCNVFFPSQVQHFSYQEQYATQPTRIYVNDPGLPTLLNAQGLASGLQSVVRDALTVAYPDAVDAARIASIDRNQSTYNAKNVLLYPEEFFRGPVVRNIQAPLWFTFLSRAQGTQPDFKDKTEAEQMLLLQARLPDADGKNIFRKYAAYEHIKARYAARSAGLSLTGFNPYPVPGFPCAVFDRRSSQVDVLGYITRVQHTLTTREMSTTISIAYGRTFSESFDLLQAQAARENASSDLTLERAGAIAMGPPEPLEEIRDITQNFERAEEFYASLFHRKPATQADTLTQDQVSVEFSRLRAEERAVQAQALGVPYQESAAFKKTKIASFDYRDIIQFRSAQGKPERLYLSGLDGTTRTKFKSIFSKMIVGDASEEEIAYVSNALQGATLPQMSKDGVTDPSILEQIKRAQTAIYTYPTKTNIRGGNQELVPTPEAAARFESHELALKYNARPICSLHEYIAFLGEDGDPQVLVPANQPSSGWDTRTFAAPYYQRIRTYRTAVADPAKGSSQPIAPDAPPDFPDRVVDWDILLEVYRNNCLQRQGPGR